MIIAHSPQAKGRIERAFGTLQERLVWEMRINHICTIEEGNSFLPKFFQEYNSKYAEEPLNSFDAYRPLDQDMDLMCILSLKEERTISKDLEVQYQNQIYQLSPPKGIPLNLRKVKVSVITTLDGELVFAFQGYKLRHVNYSELEYKKPKICNDDLITHWKDGRGKKIKPGKHHPWRNTSRVA